LHARQLAREPVQPEASKLGADTGALQVGISAQMDIAAEHAGAYQSDPNHT
jgi:hypothetical protein